MCVCVGRKVGGVVCRPFSSGAFQQTRFSVEDGVQRGGWVSQGVEGGQARGQKGQVWVAGHLSR